MTRGGKRVATLADHDFVGEIALLANAKRTATVRATTPVRCFVLTTSEFWRVLDAQPSVERKVLRALAQRVLELSADATP